MFVRQTNALIELGVKQGDRVAIYMPMIPQAAIAMLACAQPRGQCTQFVFWRLSQQMLYFSRIQDADATLVITADGGISQRRCLCT